MSRTNWIAAAVAALSTAATAGLIVASAEPPPPPALAAIPPTAGTAVTTAGARPFSTDSLAGRVWIAGFVFTRCAGPCPLVTAAMAGLQDLLPAGARLVTITVDPDHDTPDVLRGYLASAGADPDRWLAFRTDIGSLYRMMAEGFRLTVFRDPAAPEGFRVRHDTRLALVDARGRVRGYYPTDGGRPPREAARHAARLLAEAGP
jgi:protein SCO1/2